ncbi:MAG: hypothetical protein VX346_06685 [Planctomycetota bacterium]|nr:hypothetical protein [Planctomycetota bacterium]
MAIAPVISNCLDRFGDIVAVAACDPLSEVACRVAISIGPPPSDQLHQESLTRGILVVVEAWTGVLMLLKDG